MGLLKKKSRKKCTVHTLGKSNYKNVLCCDHLDSMGSKTQGIFSFRSPGACRVKGPVQFLSLVYANTSRISITGAKGTRTVRLEF